MLPVARLVGGRVPSWLANTRNDPLLAASTTRSQQRAICVILLYSVFHPFRLCALRHTEGSSPSRIERRLTRNVARLVGGRTKLAGEHQK